MADMPDIRDKFKFDELIETLKRQRDELKVRMHLGLARCEG